MDVVLAMAETPAVCEQLHLPLQSGSDRVLARMHRGYNVDRYLTRAGDGPVSPAGSGRFDRHHRRVPGETEEDFQQTLDVVAEARYDQAFTFLFSPRPGPAAAEYRDSFIEPDVAQDRYERLIALQNQVALETNQAEVGKVLEILVEGPSRKDPEVAAARSRGNKMVHVSGRHAPGTFLLARIETAAPHHLFGIAL